MPYDFILFDFDGTLFDTSEGILTGIRLALENAGIFVESDRELHKFMGPPVVQALKEFYGMTEEEAQRTKKVYREYYAKEGVFLCKPIDGAEKCLQGLLKAGKTLAVATSKPEPFARSILERFGYLRYFAAVAGGNLDETRSKKSEVISAVLQELGITDLSRAVMVGDRKYDNSDNYCPSKNRSGCFAFYKRGEFVHFVHSPFRLILVKFDIHFQIVEIF